MISIIVTTYNGEKHIEECFESVLNQTFEDTEILVVDDGSSDGTLDILKRYSDSRIKLFTQKNGGVSVARNKGMSEAKGDFIMFVDGDDKLDSNIAKELYEQMDEVTDIVICCCQAFDDQNSTENHFLGGSTEINNQQDKEVLFLQLMNGRSGQPENQKIFTAIGVPWGKLYRRKWLEAKGLKFDPGLRRMQDNVFNMYCFANARKIKYLDKPLYGYRVDNINQFLTSNKRISAETYYHVLEERENFIAMFPELRTDAINYEYYNERRHHFVSSVKSICLLNSYSEAKRQIHSLINMPLYKEILKNKSTDEFKKFKITKMLINCRLEWLLYQFLRAAKKASS